ncbi:MAG: hypothetical protein LHV69_08310 [Elusimicrobia bacterium]|nr:hypothetical protein [Candidatus Obscuribacterium magneticum]
MRLGAAPPRPAPRAPSAADMADLESSAQELVKLMEAYRQSVRRGRWFGAGPSGIYSDMTRLLKENPGLNNRSDLGVPQFMGAIRGQYVIVRQRGESTNRAIASLFSECGSALHTGQTAIAHARLKALRKYQQGGQLVGFEIEGLDGLETRLKSMEPQAGEETSKGAKSPKGGRTAAGAPKAPEKPKAEKKRPADIDKSLSEAFQKCGEALTASNLDEARRWIGEIEKLRAHLTLDEQTQLDGLKKECGLLKDLQKQVPARYQSVLKGLEGGDDQTARKLLAQLEGIQRAHPRLIGAIQKMLQDLREKLPPQEPQVPSTIQATKPAPQSETPAAVPPKAEIPPVAQPVAAVEPVSVAPPPVFTFEPVPFVEVTTSKPPSRPQPHADQLEAGLSDSKALPSPLSVGPPDEIPQEDYPPMTPDDYMLLRDREPDQAKIIRLAFEGTVQAIREGDFNYLADMVDVLSQYELTGPERARLDGLEEQLRRGASVAQEPAPIQIGDSRHSPEKAAPSDRTADHLAPPSAKEPKVEEPVSKPPPLPGAWRKLTATQDDYRIVQGRSGVHEFIIHSAFDRAEGAAREGKIEFLSSMLGVLRQYQLTSYESAHVAELEGQLRAMQASAAQASAEFTHPESVAQKREEPAPLKRADDRVVPPAAAVKPERVVPPPLPREDVPSPVSYDSRLSADGKALYDHLLGLGFFDLSKHAETGTVTERHFVPTVAENRGKIEIRAQLAGDQLKIISIDIPGPGDSGRYPQKSEAVQILANTEGGQLITWDGNALWLFDYAEEGSLVHVWAGASHLKKSVPSLPRNSGEPANPNVLRDLVKAIQGAGPIRRAFIDLSTKEAPLCLEVKAGKHILFRNQRGASSIRRADSLPSRKPAVPQTPIAPLKQPVPPKPEASGKPKVPPTAPEIERESPRPSSFKSFWDGLSDHDREVFGRRDQNDADQIGVIFRAAEEGSKQGAAEWLRVVLADLSKYKLTTAEIKRRDELSAQLAELERRAKPDGLQAEPVTEPARETPKYKLTPPLSSQPARASVRVDEVQAAQAHDKFIELRKRLVEALRTLDRKTALSIVDGDMRVMRPQFSPRQRTLGILLTDKTRFEIGHAEGMNSGDREGLKEAFSECEALLARGDIRQVKEWLSLIETIWRSEGLTFYEFEWYETLQGRVAYIGNPDGFNLPSKLQLGIIEEFYQRALRGLNENRLQLSDLLLETLEEGQKWFPRLLSARHLEILDSLKKDLDLELEEPAAPPTAVDKERESSVGLDTERESPVAPGLKRASTAPPDASIFMDDLRQRVNDILDRLIKFAFHEAIGPYLTNVPASQKSDFHKKLELLCNISWIRPEGSARWAFAIGVALESLSPEQKKAVGLTYSLQRSAEIVRILIEEIDVFQHPDLKGANQIEDTLAAAWLFNALPKDPLIATNLRLFIQEATNGEIRGFVNVLSFGNRAYEDDPAALKLLFQANELFKKRPHAGDQSLGPSHTGNWWGVLKETKYFIPPAVPLFLGSWILLGLYVYLRPQIGVLPIVLFFGVRTVCVLVAVLFFVTAGPISLRIVRSMNFVPAFVQPHFEYLKRIGKYDSYFPTGEDQRSFISYLVLHFLLFMNVVLASSCVMMGVTLPVFLEFPNYWTAFLIPGLSAVFGLVALLVVHTVIFLFFRWRGELPPSAGWNRRSRRYETDGNLREKLKAAMEGRRWSEADGTAATLRDRAKIRMRIHPPDETRRLLVEYEMRRAPIVGKRDGKLSYWYGLAKDYLESPYRGHGHELTEAWFAFRYLSSSFLKMREDKKSLYLDLIKTIRRTLSLTSLRRQNGWGDPERDMKKSFVEAVDSLWNMNPRPAEELIQQLNQYKTEGDVDFIGESLHLAAALEFLLSVKAAPRPAVLAEASGSILPYRWYKLWVAGWAEFPLALLLWLVVAPSSLSGLAPWASIVINATAVAFIFYALHGIARVLYWLFDHVYYGASMPREWPSLSSRIMGVLTAGAFLVAASFYCSGLGGIFAFLVAPSFFNNGPGEIFFIAVVLFSVMHHRMNRLVDNLQSFLKDDLAKDLLVGNWVQARMSVQSLGPSSRSVLERVKSLIEHNTRDMYWKGNLEGAISFLEQFESLYSLLSPPSRRLPQRLPSPLLSLMREDKKDETITAVERLQSAFNFTSDALGDEGFNLSDAYNGIKSLTSRLPLVQGKERIRYGDLVTSFYQKGSFLDVAAGKEEKDPLWLDFFYSVDALLRGNAKEARRVFKDLRRSLRYAPRCAGPLSALEYLLAVYDPKGQWLDVVAQRWEYFIVPSNLLFSLGLYSSFSALSPPLVMGFGLLLGVMTLFFPGFENAYLKSHRRIIDVYRYLFPKESDVASYGRYLHRRYWALNLIPVFLQTVIYGVAAAYFILPAETASFSIRRLFVAVLAFALSHFLGWAAHLANNKWGRWRGVLGAYTLTPPTGPEEEPAESIEGTIGEVVEWLRTRNRGVEADSLLAAHGIGILEVPEIRLEGPPSFRWAARSDPRPIYIDGQTIVVSDPRALSIPRSLVSAFRQIVKSRMDHLRVTEKEAYAYRVLFESADHLAERLRLPTLDELRKIGEEEKLPLELLLRRRVARTLSSYVDVEPTAASDKLSGASLSIADAFVQCLKSVAADNDRLFLARSMALSLVCQASRGDVSLVLRNADVVRLLLGGKYYPQLYSMKDSLEIIASAWLLGVSKTDRLMEALLNPHVRDLVRTVEYRSLPRDDDPPGVKILREAFRRVSNPNDSMSLVPGPAWWVKGVAPFIESLVLGFVVVASAGFIPYLVSLLFDASRVGCLAAVLLVYVGTILFMFYLSFIIALFGYAGAHQYVYQRFFRLRWDGFDGLFEANRLATMLSIFSGLIPSNLMIWGCLTPSPLLVLLCMALVYGIVHMFFHYFHNWTYPPDASWTLIPLASGERRQAEAILLKLVGKDRLPRLLAEGFDFKGMSRTINRLQTRPFYSRLQRWIPFSRRTRNQVVVFDIRPLFEVGDSPEKAATLEHLEALACSRRKVGELPPLIGVRTFENDWTQDLEKLHLSQTALDFLRQKSSLNEVVDLGTGPIEVSPSLRSSRSQKIDLPALLQVSLPLADKTVSAREAAELVRAGIYRLGFYTAHPEGVNFIDAPGYEIYLLLKGMKVLPLLRLREEEARQAQVIGLQA